MAVTLFVAFASIAASVAATDSICDRYTTALFGDNTGANQKALLTRVVNTAVIGNYTQPNVGIAVPGFFTPQNYDGENVDLIKYFNGSLLSTNEGGKSGASTSFLDGGGAAPLMQSMPADDTSSNQYFLFIHLYGFFANLLGCSQFGTASASPYGGSGSMYQVHKFMALDNAEVGWFIHNVGMSAASFGVSSDDVAAVGNALTSLFGSRCTPKINVPSYRNKRLQSICTESDCPLPAKHNCGAYAPVVEPQPAS